MLLLLLLLLLLQQVFTPHRAAGAAGAWPAASGGL
jgi:hypothetical protein